MKDAPTNATPTTPVVAATPTPAPTPAPRVLGQGIGCGLPRRAECGAAEGPAGVYGCCTDGGSGGRWDAEIWDSINRLQREQPRLFDGDRVLDREAYQLGVATIMEREYGVCAIPGGPGDEIGVKIGNDSSEQYDIYQSNARIRYPAYMVTCAPARF